MRQTTFLWFEDYSCSYYVRTITPLRTKTCIGQSRTRDKNHLSRCPGVSYSFSGRSLLDKFGQVFRAGCSFTRLKRLSRLLLNARKRRRWRIPATLLRCVAGHALRFNSCRTWTIFNCSSPYWTIRSAEALARTQRSLKTRAEYRDREPACRKMTGRLLDISR